ncbi:hypothetical protein KCV87_29620 [Actinosynnema pretiosum subsp. pretiosum]|uniref:Uncharacterized protein n=2 Tax=Actinosynnema TaxID=40566 RepID=C6W8E1_ACTMD|nr:hypothetical protein [Actinosynnema mirum]ACU38988.1 hypothetical protein Amir_5167 [Actinosynnema mirum DSM 43827]QUF03520.1 hypothetical protein KCV87_29620 [Actinosynnema pretiosum subsp. pretiosum]
MAEKAGLPEVAQNIAEYLTSPITLVVMGVWLLFLFLRRWSQFRARERELTERAAALAPLASAHGGGVTGPGDQAAPWSASVRPPLLEQRARFVPFRLYQRSALRSDLALDLRRGPWHVRVTESSARAQRPGLFGVVWLVEHRVEVATSPLPPMSLFRLVGLPHHERMAHAHEARLPVAGERDRDSRVPLDPPADVEFSARGIDLASARSAFNQEALRWFAARTDALPGPARNVTWRFESGFLYAVFEGPVNPATVLPVVDSVLGLLDRVPHARPRHPAAAS